MAALIRNKCKGGRSLCMNQVEEDMLLKLHVCFSLWLWIGRWFIGSFDVLSVVWLTISLYISSNIFKALIFGTGLTYCAAV